MRRRVALVGAGLLAVATLAGPAARAADRYAVALTASPIALDPDHPDRTTAGRLTYRGGLVLQSDDARFGGWSDLRVSADGSHMLALSDHGFWLTASLGYDKGRLAGAADARLGPLIDMSGARVLGPESDSEGMAVRPDGAIYISFERDHRIWLYPAAEPPFSIPPRRIPTPARLATAPYNGGIEALAWLSGGSLLALVEELRDKGENVGWIGDASGTAWHELHYRNGGPHFAPTGLTELPPGAPNAGDVLVLERKFTMFSGRAARIVRLPRASIRPGADLTGEELARLATPLNVDNFEGISAIPGPDGTARLYIISDDNYTFLQRTLLFMFEMK
jgi:hypothetical protein